MKKNGICSFVFVAAIMLLLFAINGYAPFGASSLACNDARIQYIDFFLYLKDVFGGQNSIVYTFSKMLGGSAVSLYSYYLASPLNLLLVFFPKTRILDFFDLLVLLKSSLAAAAFAIFLSCRFPKKNCAAGDRRFYIVLLSAGYGLSQYTVAQCCNIMWLDGVYMLPLILLGVYKAVNERSCLLLAVSAALSVLFNWYTAGMNCLFSGFWFLLEWLLARSADSADQSELCFSGALSRYLTGMVLGLLCSAALFLPTVVSLTGSEKSRLGWDLLCNISMRASPLTVFSGFLYGSQSQSDRVSLFCGTIPLLGLFGCFSGRTANRKQKALTAAAMIFVILMFYWSPLYTLFNLLEDPNSYPGRFSYVQIFSLIFFAGRHFLCKEDRDSANYLVFGGLWAALLLFFSLTADGNLSVKSCLAAVGACCFSILLFLLQKAEAAGNRCSKRSLKAAVLVLTAAELLWNANLVLQVCSVYPPAGTETPQYIEEQTAMINDIQQRDSGTYRITQTLNRWTDDNRWTANYSEPLGYHFFSLTEYSSMVSSAQSSFLEKAGYRTESDAMNIVNTCILGVDSLCGVKYVLSDLPITGLTEDRSIPGYGEKKVYQNPYAFPLAFVYSPDQDTAEAASGDPFEYQNQLFRELFGENAELYTPLEYQKTKTADSGDGEAALCYSIRLPEEECAIYGNLPYERASGIPVLDLNGDDSTIYACWLSPSVFYIPHNAGDTEAAVTVAGDFVPVEGGEQFYALDLGFMEKLTAKAKAKEVRDLVFQNGHISFSVNADAGEKLFLSVPCDPGWRIRLNGEPVSAEPFAGLFCTIPLREGENELQMDYHVPFLREGILLSLLGLGALLYPVLFSKSRFLTTCEG